MPITCIAFLVSMLMPGANDEASIAVYVGTYTEGTPSEGIYRLELERATGVLKGPVLVAKAVNPSFLAAHPSKPILYAVNEIGNYNNENDGALSAFRIEEGTGALKLINQESSKGAAPCHLVVDGEGLHVLCANYVGGNVVVKRLKNDGGLGETAQFVLNANEPGPNQGRQDGPHAHCVRIHPNGKWALLADLGTDEVRVFGYAAASGRLRLLPDRMRAQPGAGPRHLAFHPTKPFVYVNGELDSTINVFRFDADTGTHEKLQTLSTLPAGEYPGNSTAETVVHPSGKFVYVSNRGHDSIAIFAIDPKTGTLTAVGYESTQGRTPRNFNIDPSGKWLLAANQGSGTVVVFAIDAETGRLRATGQKADVPAPVCVLFLQK